MFFRLILLAILVYFSINFFRRFLVRVIQGQQQRNPFTNSGNTPRSPKLEHIEEADFTEIIDESKTSKP
jgi:hypothetical protein